MTTRRAAYTKADVKRAMAIAADMGREVAGIDFHRDGFRLLFGEPVVLKVLGAAKANEWDVVLPQ